MQYSIISNIRSKQFRSWLVRTSFMCSFRFGSAPCLRMLWSTKTAMWLCCSGPHGLRLQRGAILEDGQPRAGGVLFKLCGPVGSVAWKAFVTIWDMQVCVCVYTYIYIHTHRICRYMCMYT